MAWCLFHSITLNQETCEKSSFLRRNSFPTEYFIDFHKLKNANTFLDLGILLDEKLRFNLHIERPCLTTPLHMSLAWFQSYGHRCMLSQLNLCKRCSCIRWWKILWCESTNSSARPTKTGYCFCLCCQSTNVR